MIINNDSSEVENPKIQQQIFSSCSISWFHVFCNYNRQKKIESQVFKDLVSEF